MTTRCTSCSASKYDGAGDTRILPTGEDPLPGALKDDFQAYTVTNEDAYAGMIIKLFFKVLVSEPWVRAYT